MRPLIPFLIAVLLSACAKPGWVRAPDFSDWFNSENAIFVQEVARANVCGTAGGESTVTVVPTLASLQAWSTGRGIELVNVTGKPFPETPYAVVEFGQRPNSGYGLAISRQAGMNGSDLMLKATFFEPTQGRWSSDQPSSPCVVRATGGDGREQRLRAGTEGAP